MASVKLLAGIDIAVRRFCESERLRGQDLGAIRSEVLGLTQEQLGKLFSVSRTRITRLEKRDQVPDNMALYAYYGLLLVHFLEYRPPQLSHVEEWCTQVSCAQVEAAINRCKASAPVVDGTLSPELRVLADVWGGMIFFKQEAVDLSAYSEVEKTVISKWITA